MSTQTISKWNYSFAKTMKASQMREELKARGFNFNGPKRTLLHRIKYYSSRGICNKDGNSERIDYVNSLPPDLENELSTYLDQQILPIID